MGIDIHMNIIHKDGFYIEKDIYDSRDYKWFDNLQGNWGHDIEYTVFPREYGVPDFAPQELKRLMDEKYGYGYYGWQYVNVKDFVDWYVQYKPNITAGWVHKYDAWLYHTKGIYPEDIYPYLNQEDILADMEFLIVEDTYDSTKWLYEYITQLLDNKDCKMQDVYITYYFDH